jgi:hypothetical protein
LLAAVRQRASVVARLANHLPQGMYLCQLAYGLVVGKFSHTLAAVTTPRLPTDGSNAMSTWCQIQVACNNVAQSITGLIRFKKSITGLPRMNRVTVPNLLDRAGIWSVNSMVVKVVAIEAWMCKTSTDGKDGARNHVGAILFDDNKSETGKMTCAAKTGKITVPLRGGHLRGACGQRVERVARATQGAIETRRQEGCT